MRWDIVPKAERWPSFSYTYHINSLEQLQIPPFQPKTKVTGRIMARLTVSISGHLYDPFLCAIDLFLPLAIFQLHGKRFSTQLFPCNLLVWPGRWSKYKLFPLKPAIVGYAAIANIEGYDSQYTGRMGLRFGLIRTIVAQGIINEPESRKGQTVVLGPLASLVSS